MTHRTGKSKGFTLIELMIAIAIIGVLAAISYPSYINYTTNTRRAAAAACMTELSAFMERHYTTFMRYTTAAGAAPTLPDTSCRTDLALFYTFGFNGVPTATTFSIQAVPQGIQASRDTKCATLRLNQAGQQTQTGTASTAECW